MEENKRKKRDMIQMFFLLFTFLF